MSSRLALSIGAAAAAIFGLLLLALPAQMLAGFGLDTPNAALVVSRDVGVTLLGLAVINWLARDATGAVVDALLLGNLTVQVLEFVVNGVEILTGALPGAAAPGLLIHIILGAIFVLALRRAPERMAA